VLNRACIDYDAVDMIASFVIKYSRFSSWLKSEFGLCFFFRDQEQRALNELIVDQEDGEEERGKSIRKCNNYTTRLSKK